MSRKTSITQPISSDDNDSIQPGVVQYAVVNQRSNKRARVASDLSPVAERSRVTVHSRKHTPFEDASSTQCSTPSESAFDSESLPPSQSNTVKRRNKTQVRRQNADPATELADSIARIKKSTSAAYQGYADPVLVYEDDGSVKFHSFDCTRCNKHAVRRRVGVTETSQFTAHNHACSGANDQSQTLDIFGISGGGKKLTPEHVREYVALWMAECARPFSMINDRFLLKLFHPDVRKYLPHRSTIPQDIKRMYDATQYDIIEKLVKHIGVFHIALDLFQSSNGNDFLGIVVFLFGGKAGKPSIVERFVLECLSFTEAHTGVELATTLHSVLHKFNIHDQVWGVVCDNASNNAAMMTHLQTLGLKRLNGPLARVHCVLHVYNLVAKAIALPFHTKRKLLESTKALDDDDSEDEGHDGLDPDPDNDDDGTAPSAMLQALQELGAEGAEELPDIESGSPEDLELQRVTKVLWKAAREARRLRYNPGAKRAFKAACKANAVSTPHNIKRDVVTRWNSTEETLEDTDRTWDGLYDYQQNSRFTPRKQRLNPQDCAAVQGLLLVLKPLRQATEAMSKAGLALFAEVMVQYDALNELYGKIANDKATPLYLRHAADRAQGVLNKYYSMTDDSELYRLALLLHPSIRVHYLKAAQWEPDWIETAVKLAEDCWTAHYRPANFEAESATSGSSSNASPFALHSYMDRVLSTLNNVDVNATSPIDAFVNGTPVYNTVDGVRSPYNPLVWWRLQRETGNENQGLTQMALDVLSTPASSVDVECAFSFTGSIVSKHRHNLAPCTIQAMASLRSYSKAGLVRPGILELPRATTKAKAKAQALAQAEVQAKTRAQAMLTVVTDNTGDF